MAKVQATNTGGGLPLDPGVYQIRVLANEPAPPSNESKWDKGLPRQVFRLRVKGYADADGKPLEVRDYITLYPKLGKRSKGYSMFSALLYGGAEIPEGEPLDTDDLDGKDGQIVVKPKKEGEGTMIDSYLPTPATQPQRVAAGVNGSARRAVTAEDIDQI